jgi:hypothetical protein
MYSRVLADVNIINLIVTRVDEVTIITLTKHYRVFKTKHPPIIMSQKYS